MHTRTNKKPARKNFGMISFLQSPQYIYLASNIDLNYLGLRNPQDGAPQKIKLESSRKRKKSCKLLSKTRVSFFSQLWPDPPKSSWVLQMQSYPVHRTYKREKT